MNKKLMFALAGIGMGIGLTTTATAATSSECRQAQGMSNYYCNYVMDNNLCNYWINVVIECGQIVSV
ncbi:hypothetical protein SG34_013885 [Thalassomonas viridans]|uniref:Uncharacterized protein n=1 Tax=Thalassomonas viridans TaxID=137584 RepID=A0AAF0CD85_9GAMM|nr:hypothetical protein [Thalassomonas viridans]WDE07874.1 hypothetical protein SG34_013885 [Thalassomonas viridans]